MPAPADPPRIRVLLADDHPLIREAVRNRVASAFDMELVGEAQTGPEALHLARTLKPSVLVLDMELPGMSGIDVARTLNEESSPVRILGLSAYDNKQYVMKLLELGAAGYMTKEESVDRILEAIRGIARGEDGWLSRRAASALVQQTVEPTIDEEVALLSRREREVLLLLTDGLRNTDIAEALFIAPNTVKKHLNNIYEKIGVASRAEAVNWAWEHGMKSDE